MSFWKRLAAATGYVLKGALGDTGNPSGGLARRLGGMETAAGIAVSDASAMTRTQA